MDVYDNVVLIGKNSNNGKNTFAQFLAKHYPGEVEIHQFSEPLKRIVGESLGLSLLEVEEAKNNSTEMRTLLQRVGKSLRQIAGPTVFVDALKRKIVDPNVLYIVNDFRFPLEAEGLFGAYTVDVIRDLANVKLFSNAEVGNDISETALNSFDFDKVIRNNGTLEDLENEAIKLLEELGWKDFGIEVV